VVYGDVNSTMAAALVAVKRGVPVAHVEAGLRSGDLSMPEEINRLVTDRVSAHLYTPSEDGDRNLLAEGNLPSQIHRVGNIMIDSLVRLLPTASAAAVLGALGLADGDSTRPFVLVTLHRPSNVDDPAHLAALVEVLKDLARRVPIVFPVHPRTRPHLDMPLLRAERVHVIEPLSYPEFIDLERKALLVITDSGGVQEETTFFGVQCLTVRDNTERPVTVSEGTNTLVGRRPDQLRLHANAILDGDRKQGRTPALWDGRTAERIAEHVASL
jgi:UDP-N-acetylglucosamine 2-epimerase (non-hydrolysing)